MSEYMVEPFLPVELDDLSMVLAADVRRLMPDPARVYGRDAELVTPDKWRRFQSDWFFYGITDDGLKPQRGVDKAKAMRHLRALNGSWEPKHEHKEAAVNFLASQWFKPSSKWSRSKGSVA